MKVLIIEDEVLAVERLKDLLSTYDASIEIINDFDSIESVVAYFQKGNAMPDLILLDIQLADGISFKIFEKVDLSCPIIFTTAYDQYALEAFKVNSVDYLLKPIQKTELEKALAKYKTIYASSPTLPTSQIDQKLIQEMLTQMSKTYKKRFMVKSRQSLIGLPVEQVLFFFTESKISWLKDSDNKKYAVDYTLEELEQLLDPNLFFRINRKYILSFPAINKVSNYSNSRLIIDLKFSKEEEPIIVSREKVKHFKNWLNQ